MITLPTPLWKTCRVLANEMRLKLLQTLFEQGELCVSDLAQMADTSRPNTSNQLRLLAEHGLIISRRKKMNVFYRAEANEAMPFAPDLFNVLESIHSSMSIESVIKQATALSHGRRIEIIQALQNKTLSFEDLKKKTGISSSALARHLLKLLDRGFVRHDHKVYYLKDPANPLGEILIRLASRNHPKSDPKANTP